MHMCDSVQSQFDNAHFGMKLSSSTQLQYDSAQLQYDSAKLQYHHAQFSLEKIMDCYFIIFPFIYVLQEFVAMKNFKSNVCWTLCIWKLVFVVHFEFEN